MREPFIKTQAVYYTVGAWQKNGICAGFTVKNGGASTNFPGSLNLAFHVNDDPESVRKNREIIASAAGFPLSNWIGAEQTHEDHVQRVTRKDAGKGAADYRSSFPHTDGLYTDEKEILLVLAFADCVPVFFFAPKYGRVGIAHAGWKGTTRGIAAKMVEKWVKDGVPLDEIEVAIGPSICGECYLVDDRVIQAVRPWTGKEEKLPYVEKSPGQYALDLKQLNKIILQQAGIPESRIAISSLCTSSCEEDFFSHRRDHGATGRMLGFIGIKGAPEK
ncbi:MULTISPECIES: peptidoglycan editing factor PgeF [Heyndrickxia]|uniref:peptidoglycan editing factor PgeF n=1 Tax=Heyndrickxia TaxID=2837504 RepID=UPI00062875C3|nr:peptidoglycan editing factor PgeF [Heyndrickxia coagulans]